jgi:hypothetical protein
MTAEKVRISFGSCHTLLGKNLKMQQCNDFMKIIGELMNIADHDLNFCETSSKVTKCGVLCTSHM